MNALSNGEKKLLLYVPGTRPGFIENAIALEIDALVIDLEDSVSALEKDSARDVARYALSYLERNKIPDIIVRVNALDSPYIYEDLMAAVPCRPDAIRIPMIRNASQMRALVNKISELERKFGIEQDPILLQVMIENQSALDNLYSIVNASPRIRAVTFGGSDYAKDTGITDPQKIWEAKEYMVRSAHAIGVYAYDTVFGDLSDVESVIKDAERSAKIGFDGKSIIHPAQIPVTRSAFCKASIQ